MYRPSGDIEGTLLKSFPWTPAELTLIWVVAPVCMSWTKTSEVPFTSPVTRLPASLANTTMRPSDEIAGEGAVPESPFPWAPAELTLAIVVVPVTRSRTKTSYRPFVSPATRFVALLENTTYRPLAEIDSQVLVPFERTPAELTLAIAVVPVWTSRTKTSVLPFVSPETRCVARLRKATYRPS